jgi:hypothetical protein
MQTEKETKMMRHHISLVAALAILSVLGAWGCAGNIPEAERYNILDRNWGKSFESAKNNQILNPEAGKNLEPVTGLDGQAAEENVEEYRETFKAGPSRQVYDLNLGTISGIGGTQE